MNKITCATVEQVAEVFNARSVKRIYENGVLIYSNNCDGWKSEIFNNRITILQLGLELGRILSHDDIELECRK